MTIEKLGKPSRFWKMSGMLFDLLGLVLRENQPEKRFALFDDLMAALRSGQLSTDSIPASRWQPDPIPEKPSYHSFLKVTAPKDVPKRTALDTLEGRMKLVHAICHIEYSAFELAVDAAYRYPFMPQQFRQDWLDVAKEEKEHFLMLRQLLIREGFQYGSYPVHDALWRHAMSARNVRERMAIVPKYQEANGLDANLKIIAKLRLVSSPETDELALVFSRIHDDEIGHVARGNHWFRWLSEREPDAPDFREIIAGRFAGRISRPEEMDIKGRLAAGFTREELGLPS